MTASERRTCSTCKYENEPLSSPTCRESACSSVSHDLFTGWTPKDAEDSPMPSGGSLPDDAQARTQYPMAEGLLDYFPNALAEIAKLSSAATQQHHPEAGMHWDRSKSTEHADKIMRHLVDRGKLDDKGQRHSAMVAWRGLALLQEELERELGLPPSRASRNRPF